MLVYLLLPLVLLLVASVWADHKTFVTPLYDAFDRALSHTAVAIAAHLERGQDGQLRLEKQEFGPPLHLPGTEPPPPPDDVFGDHDKPPEHFVARNGPAVWRRLFPGARDSFLYRISLPDGRTVVGDEGLPIAQDNSAIDFSFGDATYKQQALRIASYRTQVDGQPVIVTVGETVNRRTHAVRRLDTIIGLSDGIQLLLVLGLCLFGITVALRPINRLRERITHRQPQSLQPLPLEPVPSEVRPLVQSLNTLLVTVRDAAQAQQHFLTNAAHQLRTPLTGLKAQLEVLASETNDEAQQERIARLHGSVDRLAHTANQLLALARAEPSAHSPGDFTDVQLEALIGTVADAMLDRAIAREIDLGAECAPAHVRGVHWLLHELLINLVDNAIRHTPEGGRITLRCGLHGGAAYLEVEDSGPGIPPAERERVRERFYSTTGGGGQSSGLGLAIVEEIARGHHARFQILDALEGTGARMQVTFPPKAAQE
ncbi:sensor histidine kinase [Dyella nitratireducens]|uniref:histidine kinase n=1 Tax=Dyella nitratireducens TaxID=1849580 RepID=A0ABQ1FPZ4_9GAMM|nr:two-component sensor [Dyella nitratireducens]GLQ43626.1 two-component sensor [Dyella nitratireducens]